ncbi:MAG: hypothetical protein QXR97_04475 [Thermoproteota archaeon]
MSSKVKMIDTYEDFLTYWSTASSMDIERQIYFWQMSYMEKYPELLRKQLENYEDEGLDWRTVAKEKVFSKLSEYIPLMSEARKNILTVYEPVCRRAYDMLQLDFSMILVIYVGIGCGAGWATMYEGLPAMLLGLENIVESGWHGENRLKGLIAHEIGHLTHMVWRNECERFEEMERDPLFQLYSEGFAQRCEHIIMGRESWHQAQDEDWSNWCEAHRSLLAGELLRKLEAPSQARDFFGSWFNIRGRKQTGYFLGHEFIRSLEEKRSLREIALLKAEEVKEQAILFLKDESGM